MKELTIEQKAQRYDEAIKKAKYYYDEGKTIEFANYIASDIFPELKESEDEKIRKVIYGWIYTQPSQFFDGGFSKEEMLAWLEKQKVLTTEENLQGKEDVLWCIKQAKKHAKDENEMGTCWFAEKWLEKQSEKKSTIKMKTPEESLGVDSDTYNKIVDECIYDEQKPNDKVVLQFSTYSTGAFTRGAATDVSDLCSRMNIGVFDDEGTSVKTFSQESSDTGFGTASLSLAEGTYTVVAYGHNKEKSVPVNSLTDILFSNGPSDVFLYYGTIDVTEEPQTYNLSMNRVVGMFRLILTDETIPVGVATMAVSISGGSIHLNPSTGCGGTNKTPQKTNIDVVAGQKVFEVYTFPQAGGITANITVTAKSSDGTEIAKKVFSDVPIKVNEITSYRGKMFDGVTTVTSSSMGFTANPEWGGTNEYEF